MRFRSINGIVGIRDFVTVAAGYFVTVVEIVCVSRSVGCCYVYTGIFSNGVPPLYIYFGGVDIICQTPFPLIVPPHYHYAQVQGHPRSLSLWFRIDPRYRPQRHKGRTCQGHRPVVKIRNVPGTHFVFYTIFRCTPVHVQVQVVLRVALAFPFRGE